MELRAVLHKVTPQTYRDLKRFDMDEKPSRQKFYLRPLSWILSFPDVWKHRLKIVKTGMEGVKPPFILICSHMAFLDFKVTTAALFPYRSNYIVAIDGFIGRERLLRMAGGILKRRVTTDIRLVRHLRTILHENKDIVSIYPEARYSLIGAKSILPDSLGKLVKLCKVPVVILKMHGNYLSCPVWNLQDRGSQIEAEMGLLLTQSDVKSLDYSQINTRIDQALAYDEYRWQKDNKIKISYKNRAEGLHHVIYLCPHCKAESRMDSAGDSITCGACGKKWTMDEYGQMHGDDGITEYPHLPDWYEYQREEVRREVENGTYRFEDNVRVEALVNAKGYFDCGMAHVVHTADGFTMEGDPDFLPEKLVRKPLSMYSCHVEYNYFNKGDCFDLSTLHDTYYVYPLNKKNVVTKILLATEEIYRMVAQRTGRSEE
jgi:DNA-directed RNA polymerase subunit RPC12/RpoP